MFLRPGDGDIIVLGIKDDKTNTQAFEMTGKCPFGGDRIGGSLGTPPTLSDWYPDRLKVELLHHNGPQANPLGDDFDYARAFSKIDYEALKQDIKAFLTSSVAWWPSDYGNYGPQMVRMAWHAAGTYRIADGRGGAREALQRFAPISSWWDNGNTDKSRRLIWPIKQKYGAALSWGDLMILAGNCALEIMGFPTYGFGGGRRDAWEADTSTYWGPELWDPKDVSSFDSMVRRDKRWRGRNGDADYDLENPLAASHQALIYVNPEGPYANGDPMGSARDIRITFTRMAMNDEETVALIAGGHAFGKSHGMVAADQVGPPPEIAPIEAMGLGWQNPEGTGFAEFAMTNGIEGSWTPNPTQWDNSYLENLFKFEWEQTKSPAGALQWTPTDPSAPKTPDAHIPDKMNPLMMMTSDIALKTDPEYRKVCEKFLKDFDTFTQAFSKAWYKLTHRDMGPRERYLGRRRPGSVRLIPPAAEPPWEPSSPTPRWPLRAPPWPPRASPTRSPPSSAAAPADAAAGRTAPARCARNAPGSAATPHLENASRWPSPCRHDRHSPHSAHRAARAALTPGRPRPNWPPTPTRQPSCQAPRDNHSR